MVDLSIVFLYIYQRVTFVTSSAASSAARLIAQVLQAPQGAVVPGFGLDQHLAQQLLLRVFLRDLATVLLLEINEINWE